MKAGMNTHRQNFRNLLSASGTELRRAGGIDLYHFSLSLCRYLRESGKEQAPRSIANASGEVAVAYHALNVQIFDSNPLVVAGVMIRQFVDEVFSLIGNLFVKSCNDLFCLLSAFRAKLFTGKRALLPSEIRQRRFQEAGVVGNKPIRVNGEGLHPDINANGFLSDRETTSRDLITGERNKPFSRRSATEGDGFDLSLNRTGEEQFESANFCDGEVASFEFPSPRSEGEGIVSVLSLESWKPRFLSRFDSAKERLKSSVESFQRFLCCPGGNFIVTGYLSAKFRQLINLIVKTDPFFPRPVVINSLLKRDVVEQTQRFNPCFGITDCFSVRSHPVLKGLMHESIYENVFS